MTGPVVDTCWWCPTCNGVAAADTVHNTRADVPYHVAKRTEHSEELHGVVTAIRTVEPNGDYRIDAMWHE